MICMGWQREKSCQILLAKVHCRKGAVRGVVFKDQQYCIVLCGFCVLGKIFCAGSKEFCILIASFCNKGQGCYWCIHNVYEQTLRQVEHSSQQYLHNRWNIVVSSTCTTGGT
jgi:hypothetical protein